MRYIILTLLLITAIASGRANYLIHSVSGDVKIERTGKVHSAVKGEEVKASDYVVIPSGGKLEIINSTDKRIYTSIKPGKMSVTRLMIEAKGVASDNGANVAARMRFGKKDQKGAEKLYVEKGMVRRSLAVYDPEGENIEIDAKTLGSYVTSRIRKGISTPQTDKDINLETLHPSDKGMGFRLENNYEFPIYFNIIKISEGDSPRVEISRLGQPAGSYVLLPGQVISREDQRDFNNGEKQLLILTRCQYDIDKVIEEIDGNLQESVSAEGLELPVTLYVL